MEVSGLCMRIASVSNEYKRDVSGVEDLDKRGVVAFSIGRLHDQHSASRVAATCCNICED